jgi:hypothetical protein
MGLLQRFESRLEQAVSGAFAKAFRSAVQPVEIAAALQREVDNSAQILSRDRRLAPNTFRVELSPVDHDRLAPYSETLTGELGGMLEEHADDQHYVFAGPLQIELVRDEALGTGRFRVRSRATATVTAAAGRFRAQGAAPVELEVNGDRHPLAAPGLVVGRGAEADLRINDPGISRRHARFQVRSDGTGTTVTVMDLGSTNGTLVDGRQVETAPVADGSTVRVGSTDITVRIGAAQAGAGRFAYGNG